MMLGAGTGDAASSVLSCVMLAAVWALVGLAIFGWVVLKNRLLVPSAVSFACAMTLVQDAPYRFVEAFTGHQNVTVGLLQLCTILAIVFLSWVGFAAIGGRVLLLRYRLQMIGVGVLASAALLLLFAPDRWVIEDQFLVAYLGDWRAIAFSSVQWIAMCWMAVLGWVAVRIDARRTGSLGGRATIALIGVGCLFAGAAIGAHVALVIAGLGSADASVFRALVWAQTTTQNISAIFIATGLSIVPGRTLIRFVVTDLSSRYFLWRSYTLWLELGVRDDPMCMDKDATRASDLFGRNPRARLWRRWVEIEDHVLTHRVTLADGDAQMLAKIERRSGATSVSV